MLAYIFRYCYYVLLYFCFISTVLIRLCSLSYLCFFSEKRIRFIFERLVVTLLAIQHLEAVFCVPQMGLTLLDHLHNSGRFKGVQKVRPY